MWLLFQNSLSYRSDMGLIGLRPRCLWGCIPFWRLQVRIHFLAFSNFQRPIPWLVPTPPSAKQARQYTLTLLLLSLFDHSQERLFLRTHDQTGPSWISQDNLLISRSLTLITFVKSLAPYKVNVRWFRGSGCRHLLRELLYCLS